MRAELIPEDGWRGSPERWLGGVLCQDLRAADGSRLLAKGHRLDRADDLLLEAAAPGELHLVFLETADVDEDTASVRLAALVAGGGLAAGRPVESQVNCRARWRGLVRVDRERLLALNSLEGVTVFTLPDGMPVESGRSVAGVKVTGLGIPVAALEEAEARAGAGGLVDVHPFLPRRVSALVLEGLSQTRRERFEEALRLKVEWLQGSVQEVRYLPDRGAVDRETLIDIAAASDLLLVAGVASIDPLDRPWQALLEAGALAVRRGLPVHPGSSYWVARLGSCEVVGVASCGMFSRRTALDLLLCRSFSGGALTPEYLASL
ncbi:MAG: hypothetical protein ACP5PW_09555, partial [Candidatus Dormibacteria bacterium]